jgi:hypothetical protein
MTNRLAELALAHRLPGVINDRATRALAITLGRRLAGEETATPSVCAIPR